MKKWSQLAPLVALVSSLSLLTACGGGGSSGGAGSPPVTTPTPVQPTFVDADKDGVADADDAAPNDALCSAASDANKGECFLRTLAGTRLKIVGNDKGKLFFSAEGDALMLYGYDLATGHFLGRVAVSGFTPTVYAYSADHARLYVADTKGGIHAYSEALVAQAGDFAKVPLEINGLNAVGKYLLAQDGSGAWATHYVFDKAGKLTDSREWNYYSRYYEWAPNQNRIYFFRDAQSPNDLMFEEVDQSSGKLSTSGETPYHGDYNIQGPIRASASGGKVLLGSGDIYLSPQLTWGGKIPAEVRDAMWLANDEVLIATPDKQGLKLQRYDANRRKLEELPLTGELLGMANQGGKYYLIVKTADRLDIRTYLSSDDSDGDGVSNLVDKFPLDKTASVDTDNDGHPDAFLKNYTAADSPTGLTLDAYPNDASCHLPEQGDGQRCSPALSVPSGMPDATISDPAGMVYLYSKAQGRVYRWSPTVSNYVAPIAVGMAGSPMPRTMALSTSHKRLYFGYANGQITSVDLSTAEPGNEQPFAAIAAEVNGLAAVGNFLLAQDGSGAWSTHYVIDKTGKITDSKDWNYFSHYYEWAPNQNRIYFFRDDTSPNDLMFEEVDQNTGKLVMAGETPYHGQYNIRGPIRVSLGGARIVLGSGDIYSTTDLTVTASLQPTLNGYTDLQWLQDGSLVTLQVESGIVGGTRLQVYNPALSLREQQTLAGEPVALFRQGTGVVVFTNIDGKVRFQKLNF